MKNDLRAILEPFVKWAGGKRRLFPIYQTYFPKHFNRYFEPFIGGGAVLFGLLKINPNLQATIMDNNAELINAYLMVRERIEELLELLKGHKASHCREYFYEVRDWDRSPDFHARQPVERAARFIYLNKTCFNGLYRVNASGFFNVPFGRYKNPQIYNSENLRAISRAIQNVEILNVSYESILDLAKPEDFIYFDPPYHPLTPTSYFTSYTSNQFKEEDQSKLRDIFILLNQRGCYVLLSNSSAGLIRVLYSHSQGIFIKEIQAPRLINCNASKRGKIGELLMVGSKIVSQLNANNSPAGK
jgi:DNA adenine methylase